MRSPVAIVNDVDVFAERLADGSLEVVVRRRAPSRLSLAIAATSGMFNREILLSRGWTDGLIPMLGEPDDTIARGKKLGAIKLWSRARAEQAEASAAFAKRRKKARRADEPVPAPTISVEERCAIELIARSMPRGRTRIVVS